LRKWLGIFAILQLGLSVLSFIGMMADSEAVGALLLAGVSAGMGWSSVKFCTDPTGRRAYSGRGAGRGVVGRRLLDAPAALHGSGGRTAQSGSFGADVAHGVADGEHQPLGCEPAISFPTVFIAATILSPSP